MTGRVLLNVWFSRRVFYLNCWRKHLVNLRTCEVLAAFHTEFYVVHIGLEWPDDSCFPGYKIWPLKISLYLFSKSDRNLVFSGSFLHLFVGGHLRLQGLYAIPISMIISSGRSLFPFILYRFLTTLLWFARTFGSSGSTVVPGYYSTSPHMPIKRPGIAHTGRGSRTRKRPLLLYEQGTTPSSDKNKRPRLFPLFVPEPPGLWSWWRAKVPFVGLHIVAVVGVTDDGETTNDADRWSHLPVLEFINVDRSEAKMTGAAGLINQRSCSYYDKNDTRS